jgi:processing peptidase subunit alpha
MQYGFIESVKAVYHDFSDAGVFGISVVGMAEYADYVGAAVFKEFTNLTKLTDEEVDRAKKLLKAKILIAGEQAAPRLEETVKTYAYTGLTPDKRNVQAAIDAVTKDQLHQLVVGMLQQKPTVVSIGGGVSKVPSADFFASRISFK